MAVGVQQQQRRGTEAEWITSGKILAAGEIGFATDSKVIKMGDGVNVWEDLTIPYDGRYLPIGGTAANSEMLDGISSGGFLLVGDASTAATADKVAKRDGSGRMKAAAGAADDDVVNYTQLTSVGISRTVTAAFTLALTDTAKIVVVSASAYAGFALNVPTNASVPFPIGAFVDVLTSNKGPATITPAGGVTVTGPTVLYGGGSSARLLKTDTDTWVVTNVSYSPGPVLRRKVKATIDNEFTLGSFKKMRLDGADDSSTYTNNVDTLGATEQYDAASNLYRCFARRSGIYHVTLQIGMAQNATGRAYVRGVVNGSNQKFGAGGHAQAFAVHCSTVASQELPMQVGDYLEMEVYVESGSSGQFPADEVHSPSFMSWVWQRPL